MKGINHLLLLCSLLVANGIFAQEKFSAMTSLDTVYLGNYFELSYTLENVKGEIEYPALNAFEILSGPNVASSFSIINGKSTSSYTYSYRLMPKEVATIKINPVQCKTENGILESEAIIIVVLDNPEGIQQHSQMDIWKNDLLNTPDFFKSKKRVPQKEKLNKKKRKLIRI